MLPAGYAQQKKQMLLICGDFNLYKIHDFFNFGRCDFLALISPRIAFEIDDSRDFKLGEFHICPNGSHHAELSICIITVHDYVDIQFEIIACDDFTP